MKDAVCVRLLNANTHHANSVKTSPRFVGITEHSNHVIFPNAIYACENDLFLIQALLILRHLFVHKLSDVDVCTAFTEQYVCNLGAGGCANTLEIARVL
jgi:hypothetical protein